MFVSKIFFHPALNLSVFWGFFGPELKLWQ